MSTLNPLSPERRIPKALRDRAQLGLDKVDNISLSEYVDALLDQVRAKINQDTIYEVSNKEFEVSDRLIPLLRFDSLGSTTLSVSLLDSSNVVLETCTLRLTYGNSEENSEKIQYELFVSPHGNYLRNCSFSFYQDTASKRSGYLLFDMKGISSSLIPKISLNVFQYTSSLIRLNPVDFNDFKINGEKLKGTELIYQIQCTDSSSTLTGDVDTRVSLPMYDLYGNLVESSDEAYDFPTINGVPFVGSKKYLKSGRSLRNIEVHAKHKGIHRSQTGAHDWSSLTNVPISSHEYRPELGAVASTTDEIPGNVSEDYGLVKLTPFTTENHDLMSYVKSLGEDTDVISVGAMKEFIRRKYRTEAGKYVLKSKISHRISRDDISKSKISDGTIKVPLELSWSDRNVTTSNPIKVSIQGVEVNGSEPVSEIVRTSDLGDLIELSNDESPSVIIKKKFVDYIGRDLEGASIKVYYRTDTTESNLIRSILIDVERKRSFPAVMINGEVHRLTPSLFKENLSNFRINKLTVNVPNLQSSTQLVVVPVIVGSEYEILSSLKNSSILFKKSLDSNITHDSSKDWAEIFKSFTKDHFLNLICIPKSGNSSNSSSARTQSLYLELQHEGEKYLFEIEYLQSPEKPKIIINGDTSFSAYSINGIPSSGVTGYSIAVCCNQLPTVDSSYPWINSILTEEILSTQDDLREIGNSMSLPNGLKVFKVKVNIENNNSTTPRVGSVNVSINGSSREIKFHQSSEVSKIYLDSRPVPSPSNIVIFPSDKVGNQPIEVPINFVGNSLDYVVTSPSDSKLAVELVGGKLRIYSEINDSQRPKNALITLSDGSGSKFSVDVLIPPRSGEHNIVDIRRNLTESRDISQSDRLVALIDPDSEECVLSAYAKSLTSYRLDFDDVGRKWITNHSNYLFVRRATDGTNISIDNIELKLNKDLRGDLVTKISIIPVDENGRDLELGESVKSNFIYLIRKGSQLNHNPLPELLPISNLRKVLNECALSSGSQRVSLEFAEAADGIISTNPTWNTIYSSGLVINGNSSIYPRAINFILGPRPSTFVGLIKERLRVDSTVQLGSGVDPKLLTTTPNLSHSISRISLVGYDTKNLTFLGGDKVKFVPVGVLSVKETFKDSVVLKNYDNVICNELVSDYSISNINSEIERGTDHQLIVDLPSNIKESLKPFNYQLIRTNGDSTNGTLFQDGIPTLPTWLPSEVNISYSTTKVPSKGARLDILGSVVFTECYLKYDNNKSKLMWKEGEVNQSVSLFDYPRDLISISAFSYVFNESSDLLGREDLKVDLDRLIVDIPENFDSKTRRIVVEVLPKSLEDDFGVKYAPKIFRSELVQEKSVVSDLHYSDENEVVISSNSGEMITRDPSSRKMTSNEFVVHRVSKVSESTIKAKIVNLTPSGTQEKLNLDKLSLELKIEARSTSTEAVLIKKESGKVESDAVSIGSMNRTNGEDPKLFLKLILPKGSCLPFIVKFYLRLSSDDFSTFIDVPVRINILPNFFISDQVEEVVAPLGTNFSATFSHNLMSPRLVSWGWSNSRVRVEISNNNKNIVDLVNDDEVDSIDISTPTTYRFSGIVRSLPNGSSGESLIFTPSYLHGIRRDSNPSSSLTVRIVGTMHYSRINFENDRLLLDSPSGGSGDYSGTVPDLRFFKVRDNRIESRPDITLVLTTTGSSSVESATASSTITQSTTSTMGDDSPSSYDIRFNGGDLNLNIAAKYVFVNKDEKWVKSPIVNSSGIVKVVGDYYIKIGDLRLYSTVEEMSTPLSVGNVTTIPVFAKAVKLVLSDSFFNNKELLISPKRVTPNGPPEFNSGVLSIERDIPNGPSGSGGNVHWSDIRLTPLRRSTGSNVVDLFDSPVGIFNESGNPIQGTYESESNPIPVATFNSNSRVLTYNQTPKIKSSNSFILGVSILDSPSILTIPISFSPSTLGYFFGASSVGYDEARSWSNVSLNFESTGGNKSLYVVTDFVSNEAGSDISFRRKVSDTSTIVNSINIERDITRSAQGKNYYRVEVSVKLTNLSIKSEESIDLVFGSSVLPLKVTRNPAEVKFEVSSTDDRYTGKEEIPTGGEVISYFLDPSISHYYLKVGSTSSFHGKVEIPDEGSGISSKELYETEEMFSNGGKHRRIGHSYPDVWVRSDLFSDSPKSESTIPLIINPSNPNLKSFPKIILKSNARIFSISYIGRDNLSSYRVDEVALSLSEKPSGSNYYLPETEIRISPEFFVSETYGKPAISENSNNSHKDASGKDPLYTKDSYFGTKYPYLGKIVVEYSPDGTEQRIESKVISVVRRSIPKLGITISSSESLRFHNSGIFSVNHFADLSSIDRLKDGKVYSYPLYLDYNGKIPTFFISVPKKDTDVSGEVKVEFQPALRKNSGYDTADRNGNNYKCSVNISKYSLSMSSSASVQISGEFLGLNGQSQRYQTGHRFPLDVYKLEIFDIWTYYNEKDNQGELTSGVSLFQVLEDTKKGTTNSNQSSTSTNGKLTGSHAEFPNDFNQLQPINTTSSETKLLYSNRMWEDIDEYIVPYSDRILVDDFRHLRKFYIRFISLGNLTIKYNVRETATTPPYSIEKTIPLRLKLGQEPVDYVVE